MPPKTKAVAPMTTARRTTEKRTFPVGQGGCPKCGHLIYPDYGPAGWCPDEDCHPGGYLIPATPLQRVS